MSEEAPIEIPTESGEGRVYILIQEDGTRCKIGKTKNLAVRMRDLGRLNAQPLHLACLLEGYSSVEKWFHTQFAQYHVHGEWFRLEGELAECVGKILDGATTATLCPANLEHDVTRAQIAAVPDREVPQAPVTDLGQAEELAARRAEVEALQLRILRRKCRTWLSEFCKAAWHALHPTTRLEWSWHHDALCDHLQWALEGWMRTQEDPTFQQAIRWLLINVPPGTLKTEIIMVFAPAWMWMRWPSWRVLCLSSNPKVALQSAVDSRRVITSKWYQETFAPTWSLREDQNAKGDFGTTEGGSRLSHGMTAAVVGEHADCILLDDPNDPKEINSKSAREEVQRAWDDAIQNRVTDERHCLRIAIQQRVDLDDWTGHVTRKKNNKWIRVTLPMEFEVARRCVTPMPVNANGRLELNPQKQVGTWRDPRVAEGEVLHPARFPEEVLEVKRSEHGPYGYACTPAETPILMDDWTEKRIADVRVGDRVVGFNLGTPSLRARLVPAEVTNITCIQDEVFELEMESGRTVRCTADHRWFDKQRKAPGRKSYLEVAVGRSLCLVADPLRERTLGEEKLWSYLAGIVDGEGSLKHRALTISQNPRVNPGVCQQIEDTLFELGLSYKKWEGKRCNQYTVHNVLRVHRELIKSGLGKAQQARDALYRRGGKFIQERDRVLSMRSLGVQRVYALETTTGNYIAWGYASANCQYQQRPGLRDGGMVKKSYWRFFRLAGHTFGDRRRPPDCVQPDDSPTYEVKALPKTGKWDLDFIEITVDAANKKTDRGSLYGMLAVAGKENRRFILHDASQRGDFQQDILPALRRLVQDWRPSRMLIEDKAAGPQIISTLREEIAGGKIVDPESGEPLVCAIEPLEPDGDKVARMEAVTPQLAANLVYLPEGAEWVEEFVEELGNFPNGMTDRGDALSQFLAQHRMGTYASMIAQGGLRLF